MNDGKIFLAEEEVLEIAAAACKIRLRHMRSVGHKEKWKAIREGGWNRCIEGYLGEYAVYKYLLNHEIRVAKPCLEVGKYDCVDIKDACEVRTTIYPNGTLPIHETGHDPSRLHMPFVNVTGSYGDYVLTGWIWGHEYKERGVYEKKHKDRDFEWWIYQDKQRPMEELVTILRDKFEGRTDNGGD
jgi:hypothetical protein